jgi:anti-sigma factor RsiW
MSKFTRLTPEQREELIAYLDGELEPLRQETIEASLSQNQVARHDLNQLSKTYDLLTFLPKVTPTPELTERTLSRIEVRESQVWTSFERQSPATLSDGNGLVSPAFRDGSRCLPDRTTVSGRSDEVAAGRPPRD